MIYRMSSSKIFSFLLFLLLFATPSKSQNIYIETAKKYSTQTVDYQKFIEEKIVQKDILRCPEPIKMTLKPPFKVYADSAYFLWFVHPYYAKKYEQEILFTLKTTNLSEEVLQKPITIQNANQFTLYRNQFPSHEKNVIVQINLENINSCDAQLITWLGEAEQQPINDKISEILTANQSKKNALFYFALSIFFLEQELYTDAQHCVLNTLQIATPKEKNTYQKIVTTFQAIQYQKLVLEEKKK
jgi:hypothetical protein